MNDMNVRTMTPLVYNGVEISARAEMVSLTDMWRAAGSPSNQDPPQWARTPVAEAFIEAVSTAHNMGKSHVLVTRRGKGGGTMGHWQIGLAYAKYLSPEFHMWCNEVVRAHMQGRAVETAHSLTDYDKRIVGNIVKQCVGVVLREYLETIAPQMVAAQIASASYTLRVGKTSGQIWAQYGLPRLKNAPTWLGNRMAEMGCSVSDEGRAEIGGRRARLFDPDKASICMKNGLLEKARQYAMERMGQGRLQLVSGKGDQK